MTYCYNCDKEATDGDGDENVCSYTRCNTCDEEILIPICISELIICCNCPIR